jgi:hypothetical protein
VVKISAQSVLFSSFIVNFIFLNLVLDIWIRNPDAEYGSGSRPKLNADLTGSGSKTLASTHTKLLKFDKFFLGLYCDLFYYINKEN